MYCNACGKQVPDDALFCSSCGRPMSAAAAAHTRPELVRPRNGRWIAGVCLGVANHFGWSPGVLRLIWLLFFLFAGAGGLLYIILWIIMPSE